MTTEKHRHPGTRHRTEEEEQRPEANKIFKNTKLTNLEIQYLNTALLSVSENSYTIRFIISGQLLPSPDGVYTIQYSDISENLFLQEPLQGFLNLGSTKTLNARCYVSYIYDRSTQILTFVIRPREPVSKKKWFFMEVFLYNSIPSQTTVVITDPLQNQGISCDDFDSILKGSYISYAVNKTGYLELSRCYLNSPEEVAIRFDKDVPTGFQFSVSFSDFRSADFNKTLRIVANGTTTTFTNLSFQSLYAFGFYTSYTFQWDGVAWSGTPPTSFLLGNVSDQVIHNQCLTTQSPLANYYFLVAVGNILEIYPPCDGTTLDNETLTLYCASVADNQKLRVIIVDTLIENSTLHIQQNDGSFSEFSYPSLEAGSQLCFVYLDAEGWQQEPC